MYNGWGEEIIKGKVYYTREHNNSCLASGNHYRQLGYKTPVTVKAQTPVVIRTAEDNYKCLICGCNIDAETLYAKPVAKFSTDKYCIDCITPNDFGELIGE